MPPFANSVATARTLVILRIQLPHFGGVHAPLETFSVKVEPTPCCPPAMRVPPFKDAMRDDVITQLSLALRRCGCKVLIDDRVDNADTSSVNGFVPPPLRLLQINMSP